MKMTQAAVKTLEQLCEDADYRNDWETTTDETRDHGPRLAAHMYLLFATPDGDLQRYLLAGLKRIGRSYFKKHSPEAEAMQTLIAVVEVALEQANQLTLEERRRCVQGAKQDVLDFEPCGDDDDDDDDDGVNDDFEPVSETDESLLETL